MDTPLEVPTFIDTGRSQCPDYTSGNCCKDRHFDASEVIGSHTPDTPICGKKIGYPDGGGITTTKEFVNCKDCLELIHG